MLRTQIIVTVLLLFLCIPDVSIALRCGSDLASHGDFKHEVLMACGTPYSQEVIGYIDHERDGDRIRVMKVEEWIIEESGYYYRLIFEGNVLMSIESAGESR